MFQLLKSSLYAYIAVAAIVGVGILAFIYVIFKKTKNINNKKLKVLLRVVVGGISLCLWAWFYVYVNLYPISLAYYEYTNGFAEEKVGIIDSITNVTKDRISLIVDGVEYTIIDNVVAPIYDKDIGIGDTVKLKFGKRSMYVFDIDECDTNS